MNYQTDITEILKLIVTALPDESNNYDACLERFTAFTDEEYLRGRAEKINEEIRSNKVLQAAFGKLASVCRANKTDCKKCIVNKYCNHYINAVRNKADYGCLKMVDLFCGAGGLSLGFCQEGFIPILANDIEECCVDTYAHNHPEIQRDHIILGDIRVVVDELEALVNNRAVDIVVGGPPCQGFSMANRQRLIDDPRNNLYRNYVEVVRRTNPRFFVMENVKGMLSVSEQVKEDFMNIGYEVECQVLNAADFGVPQNRERLIFIGNRMGIDNHLVFQRIHELSQNIPNYILMDAIEDLRPLRASNKMNSTEEDSEESGNRIERKRNNKTNDYINLINQNQYYSICLNHKARYNNPRDIEIFSRLNPGDKSDDPKIADIMPYSRRNGIFKDKYYKLQPDKVCKTITAHMKFDCNMYIHPFQARGLTPREAARIQSFPDDYYFRGPFTKTYMQIGNSVPPLLGRAIAHIIKDYL